MKVAIARFCRSGALLEALEQRTAVMQRVETFTSISPPWEDPLQTDRGSEEPHAA